MQIFKGQRLEEAEKALSDIRDRHEDIQRLERSLIELHEMFVDMSILVSEQGEMIDRIEYSVAKSGNYVESARKKVKRAEELQRAARQKRWCCLISLLILGTFPNNKLRLALLALGFHPFQIYVRGLSCHCCRCSVPRLLYFERLCVGPECSRSVTYSPPRLAHYSGHHYHHCDGYFIKRFRLMFVDPTTPPL